jgi:uncharacterized protein YceH (UPF0502 family)
VDADAVEIRILGSLVEKQRTTPDQYPLSLNALRLACNQATNRDPVVDYDEAAIRAAIERLSRRGWVRLASGPGSRVAKYRHLLDDALGRVPSQLALLAVLMLRGPQTPGELKQRVERLYPYGSTEEVEKTLEALAEHELVEKLPRRPGQSQDRWIQLLGGDGDGHREPGGALNAVKALYQSGADRLDRDVLYELLADNVEWQVAGSPDRLPWAGTVHGHDGVHAWLELLNDHLHYERFDPLEIFGDDENVVEIISAGGRAAASGHPYESEIVRIWTFRQGKAVRVRSYYDTAAYERAFTRDDDRT